MMISRKQLSALLLTALAIAACGDDITEFSEQFLIRRPTDSLIGTAPSYTASATGTDSLKFEWGQSVGADRYTIVFLTTESTDSMNRLTGDLDNPTFTVPVASPKVVEVPVNPADTTKDNYMRVSVVAHGVPSKDLDGILAEAGVQPGGSINTIFSVVAHHGSRDVRSVEVQRLVLRRK